MSAMHHQPDGAAFDVVLLLHVACVVTGLVTTLTAAATAARLRRHLRTAAPLPDALRRYFRPGVNWAGRTMYGIPVFGFALLAMSQGAYSLRQGWVFGGVAIFAAMMLVAEGMLWPAERRLQGALAVPAGAADATPGLDIAGTGTELPDSGVPDTGVPDTGVPGSGVPGAGDREAGAATMARAAQVVLVLMVAGVILMIAQP
jgi:hypothetical protein